MSENPALKAALNDATIDDVEFTEKPMGAQTDDGPSKVGCTPSAVKGVAIPTPPVIVFVRSKTAAGDSWFVVDSTQRTEDGKPKTRPMSSEVEAKVAVLNGLKAAYGG